MDSLPIPVAAADALAAVLRHSAAIEAEERGLVLAIATSADTYRVDESVLGWSAERRLFGGGDGTPTVSQYLCLELGGLLGCSPGSAAHRIAGVLNVRHRHPRLWEAFLAGRVRWWHAEKVALACLNAGLDAEATAWVDAQLVPALALQPVARVLGKVDGLIVRADPELAARKAEQAARGRHVRVDRIVDGHTDLWGRLDAGDGIALDQALDQIADTLPSEAERGARRATALGLLARSVFGQDALPTSTVDVTCGRQQVDATPSPLDDLAGHGVLHLMSGIEYEDELGPEEEDRRPTLAGLPLFRQRRSVQLIIRLEGTEDDVACIADRGVLLTGQLAHVLAGCHVTVRPVVIPADLPAEDGYQPSSALKLAVTERNPVDVFPYGTIAVAGCDLDHTIPYDHTAPPGAGQTRADNLAPISRRPHRGKTHGGWQVEQPAPGLFHWTSPAGYEYLVDTSGTTLIRTPQRTPTGWPTGSANVARRPPGLPSGPPGEPSGPPGEPSWPPGEPSGTPGEPSGTPDDVLDQWVRDAIDADDLRLADRARLSAACEAVLAA